MTCSQQIGPLWSLLISGAGENEIMEHHYFGNLLPATLPKSCRFLVGLIRKKTAEFLSVDIDERNFQYLDLILV